VLEAPRAGGPVRVGLCRTLLPLTLPHEGGRGEQRTRSILFDYFSFFFSFKINMLKHALKAGVQMNLSEILGSLKRD